MNASEASDAVSVANVPPEIRDQLATWIQKQPKGISEPEPVDGLTILSRAADEDGIITLDSLNMALSSLNSSLDAEAFAEEASAEGELLRVGVNRWKRT